ncbi:hypothetical protein BKA61DRAFT_702119 [Leptodontidium sp. MPI-SDFR-AT-0119]|nr:hypothetical protein BKA61DRAFT_702119 [Leptodontidium sp. MPI-SDFR-AT-0119]
MGSEKFSTIPHNLGYYRSVANTARYRTDTEPQLLGSIIEAAVAQVVLKHSALCCGIINEDTNDAAFIRLDSISLSKCIRYHIPKPSQSEDEAIVEALEFQHGELWLDLGTQPPWKIIVVPTRKFPETKGTVPRSITLTLPLEKAVLFKISWMFFLMILWDNFKPKWLFPAPTESWTGGAVCSEDLVTKYKTNVKLFEISAEDVSGILTVCKAENATLTGLLHGLIIASLAKRIPSAEKFTSATPYSLRHLTGLSPTEEMGVHVGSLKIQHPTGTISNLRSSNNQSDTMSRIWEIARTFRSAMRDELAGLPNDNLLGMIPYISDLRKMFVGMMGKRRSTTYEISNVGSLKVGAEGEGGKWRIQRDVFSQSASVTGAAMYFNVASVAGGPLTIAITWLEGVVDGEVVGGVKEDLEYGLRCVGEGKEILLSV